MKATQTIIKTKTVSIRDLPYYREEDEEIYSLLASPEQPLRMPELEIIKQELNNLKEYARKDQLDERAVLFSYFKLLESHLNTDIFCGWKDNEGKVCGGVMHIEVFPIGAYYQCEMNQQHRTKKK